MTRPAAEDASLIRPVTLLVLVILLSLLMYTLFVPAGLASGQAARAGMARVTDAVVPDGDLTGYADLAGTIGTVRVANPRPESSKLGAVTIPLKLASVRLSWETGTGADLGNATVSFTGPSGTEALPRSDRPVLEKPAWAIIRKGSSLPGQYGNGNDLLEPNEVFVLFVYPSRPLPEGTPFTVRITIPDENPVTIHRVVPDPVIPVMNLG